ncbi:MAG: transcriptional regulator [Verrucomicrobiaceae bacterium]|nr:transcriptional regulator [Verrucomicrobiaceae bacterium]
MFHYKLCGLPNVYLENGFSIEETPYGEAFSIQDLKGLHKAIGLCVIESAEALSADEIRYLRKEMDMSQRRLAEFLDVKEITVRKWESGDNAISGTADRLLRFIYKDCVDDKSSIKDMVDRLNQLDKKEHVAMQIQFVETENGWQKKVAAA